MTLTFGAGSPGNLLLGVVVDSSDGLQFSNGAILVNGVSTGTLTNDLQTDVHTFRLASISPGDTVRIDGLASTANVVCAHGRLLARWCDPRAVNGRTAGAAWGMWLFTQAAEGSVAKCGSCSLGIPH